MEDPVVVCTTGQTYDRGALEEWFQRHKPATDPTTNVVLSDTAVVPNWALREALTEYHKTHRLAPLAPPAVQVSKRASKRARARLPVCVFFQALGFDPDLMRSRIAL